MEGAPTTRTCAWPAPPLLRETTLAQMKTSSTVRYQLLPSTPRYPTRVTRLPSSTVKAARTARQRSGYRCIQTHSSYTATWCVLMGWITETWKRFSHSSTFSPNYRDSNGQPLQLILIINQILFGFSSLYHFCDADIVALNYFLLFTSSCCLYP